MMPPEDEQQQQQEMAVVAPASTAQSWDEEEGGGGNSGDNKFSSSSSSSSSPASSSPQRQQSNDSNNAAAGGGGVGDDTTSSTSGATASAAASHPQNQTKITETKAVFRLKILVLVILIASTVGVAFMIYWYTSEAESKQFEERFNDEASTLLDAVAGSFFLSLGALDSYVVDLVKYANYSNSEWPFVALPKSAVRAAKVRALSKSFYFGHYIRVTPEQRDEWENFTLENDGWVDEALEVQKHDANYHGVHISEYEPYGRIFNHTGGDSGPADVYLPIWGCYPMVPIWPPYNWDANTFNPISASYDEIFNNRRVVVRLSNMPDINNPASVEEASIFNDWAKDYIKEDDDETEPIINVFYPISTDSLDSVTQPHDPTSSPGSVVGMVDANIYWRELIQNILPPGTGGITAVFDVGEHTFTYAIEGPVATYLGVGDLHDARYNRLERSSQFLDIESSTYTGLPLSADARALRMRIYPSAAMEATFISNDPIIYTVVAVLTFAFTSALFIIYDHLRTTALKKATETAEQSSANVVLLEERVKERTKELEETNRKLGEANRRVTRASEAQLRHFACMSHEIRTPLNCVIGMSSLLRHSGDLTPMQEDSMQMIMSSGELLLTIVDDVLDYSKLESGNVEIKVKRSSLQEALSSTIHSMQVKGASRNVNVIVLYDPTVPEFIDTDTRRLSQVLYNLIANAVKFSKLGGTVEFGVSVVGEGIEEAQLITTSHGDTYSPPRIYQGQQLPELRGNRIRFVVKDYGRGINPRDFQKIFRPFLQADGATETLYGGTGLGLSITSKLTHGLGGSITVESVEGEGSTFTVDLPLNEDPIDTADISSGLENATMLLIGCERTEQERMVNILRALNIHCACFPSFQELKECDDDSLLSTERTLIFVSNEDVFDHQTYKPLSRRAKSLLLTFGPLFKVKETLKHYRSLTQVLPSILLGNIVRYMQKEDPERQVGRNSSIINVPVSSDIDLAAVYKSMRFLIAEDNLVNQKVLSRILSRLGVENIVVVDNGAKAVEREAAEHFDVVFMDMQMPIMDGIEACRQIVRRKDEQSHPQAKVIFVTAHVSDSFKSECLEIGAVDYLAKPCKIQGVKKCLEDVAAAMSTWSKNKI